MISLRFWQEYHKPLSEIQKGALSVKKQKSISWDALFLEATSGFGPENNGFADHCLTTWLCRLKTNAPVERERTGADYGARTRHLDLGKVALYQMS